MSMSNIKFFRKFSELELKTSETVIVILTISAAAKIVDIRTKYLIMDRLNLNSKVYPFLD